MSAGAGGGWRGFLLAPRGGLLQSRKAWKLAPSITEPLPCSSTGLGALPGLLQQGRTR